jgi:large subunit ribosomal protein L15
MNLSNLVSITEKSKRRLGQGHGSGRVKTSGRGTKGQKARNKVPQDFEGGALPLIKRMPFLRGKNRNKSRKPMPVVLNLSALNKLPKNAVVDIETLAKHNLVNAEEAKVQGIKILGNGELNVSLTCKLPVTKSAAQKIEKAGGSINLAHE